MLISILTATFNSQQFIQQALTSFSVQHYDKKELLVLDGNSQDETLNIIKQNSSIIKHWVSEPDQGIYDALNKGIHLAKGDVIGILHSDDFFADEEVLTEVAQVFINNPEIEAVYGDLEYVERNNPDHIIRRWVSGKYQYHQLKLGWMPPHPALFIKRTCFDKFGKYDAKYHSAADYDLILRFLFKNQIKVAYLPKVLVKMRVGGLSNKSLKNRLRANKEDRLAMKVNGLKFPLIVAILKPLRKLGQYWNKNH